ncbi:hypothetical protein SLA2020_527520 [Shorea laevis]
MRRQTLVFSDTNCDGTSTTQLNETDNQTTREIGNGNLDFLRYIPDMEQARRGRTHSEKREDGGKVSENKKK